jgi:hypothetical protein
VTVSGSVPLEIFPPHYFEALGLCGQRLEGNLTARIRLTASPALSRVCSFVVHTGF